MSTINKEQFNEDKEEFIKCPCCDKFIKKPNVTDNVILVYNCNRCSEPIILFKNQAFMLDNQLVDMDDQEEVEEFVIEFLAMHGLIGTSSDAISDQEIQNMKNFLTNFKIPKEGDFL